MQNPNNCFVAEGEDDDDEEDEGKTIDSKLDLGQVKSRRRQNLGPLEEIDAKLSLSSIWFPFLFLFRFDVVPWLSLIEIISLVPAVLILLLTEGPSKSKQSSSDEHKVCPLSSFAFNSSHGKGALALIPFARAVQRFE